MLSQKVEEGKQMKQDLQRAQSLFSSAERELRYEKEKNLDLKRHNSLLDQEKLKVDPHACAHRDTHLKYFSFIHLNKSSDTISAN